jgi:glycosyltransferase involved in cell wall biosynthesis
MPLYLRRASAALSVSELTTQHFNRIFDLPPGKVRTTYFGPASHFRPVQDRGTLDRVKRRYALPDRFILTLSKGAGGERKNFRGILKAYERLHGAVPHSLVVVGKGCERFRGDYEIPDVGWGTRVRFPGWVEQEDLPAVYTLADVFLYPSNMEAFPIPLTEAMACGKAIVTSSVNGLREIAGDAALLVDPADADAVAGAVASVLVNEHLRETLESASLERARSFSWDACARQTLDALEEVASRRRTRGSPRRGRNRSEGLEAGAQ